MADLGNEFAGEPSIFRFGHQSLRVGDAFVREKIQEWRLPELGGKAMTKRSIEHRLACGVREVGEDDAALVGEFCGGATVKADGEGGDEKSRRRQEVARVWTWEQRLRSKRDSWLRSPREGRQAE